MITYICVACGAKENLYEHHLVPKSLGGSDEDTNIIVLCGECHAKVHGKQKAWHISALTKVALQKAKARGVKIGKPENLRPEQAAVGRPLGRKALQDKADFFARSLAPLIDDLLKKGMNYSEASRYLNSVDIKSPRGKKWKAQSVKNIINRIMLLRKSTLSQS